MIISERLTLNGKEFDMLPKKIYLNYVKEDDVYKTWSEEPISASDCEMNNREYTDLSQVWHNIYEIPINKNRLILFCDKYNCIRSEFIPYEVVNHLTQRIWNQYIENEEFVSWAYVYDFLPKGLNHKHHG